MPGEPVHGSCYSLIRFSDRRTEIGCWDVPCPAWYVCHVPAGVDALFAERIHSPVHQRSSPARTGGRFVFPWQMPGCGILSLCRHPLNGVGFRKRPSCGSHPSALDNRPGCGGWGNTSLDSTTSFHAPSLCAKLMNLRLQSVRGLFPSGFSLPFWSGSANPSVPVRRRPALATPRICSELYHVPPLQAHG